ncbi:hypothetical protein ABT160_33925 [Streptomyces sp. NPDC001941]|uniref:hypothetical protein n=1 Tax=Streptomyces sp. NPDC001941 TaxID=3154659 RepID=UPI00332DD869
MRAVTPSSSPASRRAARLLVAAGLGLAVTAAVAAPAGAAGTRAIPDPVADWGTVIDTEDCVQADAWALRVIKKGGLLADSTSVEARYPSADGVPSSAQTLPGEVVDLRVLGVNLHAGQGVGVSSRALGHTRIDASGDPVPQRGAVYAETSAAMLETGHPYIPGIPGFKDGVQLSPVGVHLENVKVTAQAEPGKPVAMDVSSDGGYLSIAGHKIKPLPAVLPPNFGVRVPDDRNLPPLFTAVFNEQVTTDAKGRPTHHFDPRATSGYANALHLSILGTHVADITVGHAAVLRDPARTDKYAKD